MTGRADDAGAWQPSAAMRVMIGQAVGQFGCTVEEFFGPQRPNRIVRARMAAVWVLRRRWNLTWVCVARAIGREARDTAKHLDARARYFRERDQRFAEITDALLADKPLPRVPMPLMPPLPPAPRQLRKTARRIEQEKTGLRGELPEQQVKPKNRIVADDTDALSRHHGTLSLVGAIAASGGRFR